jgi:beta-phosphoglucomutase family hydrolase
MVQIPPLPNPVSLVEPVLLSRKYYDAVLFDLDGVVTRTAEVHAAAWKQVFDEFLQKKVGPEATFFDIEQDYQLYVDGKPRYEGVDAFLKSRGIPLPRGHSDDSPGLETICSLGNYKNQIFQKRLHETGVMPYTSSVTLIKSLKTHGFKTAVITASKNGTAVLEAANLLNLFDVKIDGLDAERLRLKGKPKPDVFLEASQQLKVLPERAIVIEDAIAGVEAGRKGHFGLVIGVERYKKSGLLKDHGADVVVKDLEAVCLAEDISTAAPEEWILEYKAFIPEEEKKRESLCTLGNGYFATRGAAPETSANSAHYPGTYLAGGYNRLKTELAGCVQENEDLVNMPNWLSLKFQVNDSPWFDLSSVQILSYRQALNIREGVLYRDIRLVDQQGRETSLSEKRFVHMRHFHLAGLETSITPQNWSGRLTFQSAIDGQILNTGTRGSRFLNHKHLEPLETSLEGDILYLKVQTSQSRLEVAQAVRTSLFKNGFVQEVKRTPVLQTGYVAQEFFLDVEAGDQIRIEKIASLFTSRDDAIPEAGLAAQYSVKDAPDFTTLLNEQKETWRHLWRRFDLDLETAADGHRILPSLVLHLHIFHVLQTISLNSLDLDIGIPARGWSGEAYRGHIFWDELFIFPFLNLRMPKITGALLKYRFRRLDEARRLAMQMGAKGACYPWQSGSSGREETPRLFWDPDKQVWLPDYTYKQLHVNSAVAYNVWQYYQATGNLEFMFTYGAEMLLEIARFWGSLAQYNPALDRYEIKGVVGPDEYHQQYPDSEAIGIDNNAYTNLMAVWVLCRAMELLEILPADNRQELWERLNLTTEELELWARISRKMLIIFQDGGIISQFEGYEKLMDFPWYRPDGSIDSDALEGLLKKQSGKINQYKVSKQADVLMLFYLFSAEELQELLNRLGYAYEYETIPRNIAYYTQQTAHGSTLSRVGHAWVLSRLDRGHAWELFSCLHCNLPPVPQSLPWPLAWDIFLEALGSDYFDIQGGTTSEGIHLGAMAGTVDIVQRCYTGIVTRGDVLWLNPRLPDSLTRLSFSLHYRNQALDFEITQEQARVTARPSGALPIRIGFKDKAYEFKAGETRTFLIRQTPCQDAS